MRLALKLAGLKFSYLALNAAQLQAQAQAQVFGTLAQGAMNALEEIRFVIGARYADLDAAQKALMPAPAPAVPAAPTTTPAPCAECAKRLLN